MAEPRVFALPATLTLAEASAVAAAFRAALAAGPGAVVVDAAALKVFDSAALAVLLECVRAGRQAGREVVVQGVPPPLAELAGLYGIDQVLPGFVPSAGIHSAA